MPQQRGLARALTTAAFLTVALLTASARAQEYRSDSTGKVGGWLRFEPKGEEFSIRMPSPPRVMTRTVRPGKGRPPVIARDYVALGPVAGRGYGFKDEVRYIVTSMELPAAASAGGGVIKREEFDKLMYTLQESFEKGLQAAAPGLFLGSPREVISGIHTGREFGIEGGRATYEGHVRFFATSKHIYLVGYINFSYYGTAYLESFELKSDNRLIISR